MANPEKKETKPNPEHKEDPKREERGGENRPEMRKEPSERPSWVGSREEKSADPGGGNIGRQQGKKELICCGETFATQELYNQHRSSVHAEQQPEQAPVGV